MKDKVWEANFDGHNIMATNKISFFPPRTSEVLEIDGVVIEHLKGSFFRMHSTILSKYNFNGTIREVEVRIAQKAEGVGTGCQILVDGNIVAGDKSIQYPDLEKAKEQLEKGFFHHFIFTGLPNYGLPYAAVMLFANKPDSTIAILVTFMFHICSFGGGMSYLTWRGIKSRVALSAKKL
jgi:hypothetical protein